MPGPDDNPETRVANAIEQARAEGLIAPHEDIDPVQVMILLKIARGEIHPIHAATRIAQVGAKQFAQEVGIEC